MRILPAAALVVLVCACGGRLQGAPPEHLMLFEATANQIAVIDSSTRSIARYLPLGVPSNDWNDIYSIKGDTLIDTDPSSGVAKRSIELPGLYQLPPVTSSGLPGGTSPNGMWLVLVSSGSHFLIVNTQEWRIVQTANLSGDFHFDAISDDGQRLYLIQYLNGREYYIRLYDVPSHRLDANIVVDKSNGEQSMTGSRLAGIATPGGEWLFSMYVRESESPFIHALNLTGPFAFCLDLPGGGYSTTNAERHWSIAMDWTGSTLFAINSATGVVAHIDNSQQFNPQVKRTAHIPGGSSAGVGSDDAVVSRDGKWLVAAGSSGVVWIDTRTLTVGMRALPDWHVWSIGLSPDGTEVYALSDDGRVADLATMSGRVLSTFATTEGRPVALMRVASA